eukprot:UN12693
MTSTILALHCLILFISLTYANTPPKCGACVSDCTGVDNGNYLSCINCHGYVTCSHGYLHERKCAPGSLVWDDSRKTCNYYSSCATNPCDPTTDIPTTNSPTTNIPTTDIPTTSNPTVNPTPPPTPNCRPIVEMYLYEGCTLSNFDLNVTDVIYTPIQTYENISDIGDNFTLTSTPQIPLSKTVLNYSCQTDSGNANPLNPVYVMPPPLVWDPIIKIPQHYTDSYPLY